MADDTNNNAPNGTADAGAKDKSPTGDTGNTKDNTPAQPSHGDWAGMNKTMRDIATALAALPQLLTGQSQKTSEQKQAPANDEQAKLAETVNALQKQLRASQIDSALTASFAKHGIADAAAQALIKKAVESMNPEKIGEFVDGNAVLFKKPEVPGAKPTSNTGAAGTDNKQIPKDVKSMSPEAYKALSPQEKRALRASAAGGNPVRAHLDGLAKK